VGPSGRGKSTLAACITRLLDTTPGFETNAAPGYKPQGGIQKGSITFGGRDIYGMYPPFLRKKIGYIQQKFTALESSVSDEILYPVRKHKLLLRAQGLHLFRDREMEKQYAYKILKMAGLEVFANDEGLNRRPWSLSGGQQQRLNIARTLGIGPDILLCDEVTTALDEEVKLYVQETLHSLAAGKKPMLLITHSRHEAFKMAGRIAVMHDGEIVEEGDVEQIFCDPQHDFTRTFVGNLGKEFGL